MVNKMKRIIKMFENKKNIFLFLMAFGILVRIICFVIVPGGLNQDEAYSGYEAYSIVNYGVDSWGYSFPVYLKTWGSGMNALQSYLAIPFIKIFGLSVFTIRLPMLIVSCFSLYAFYLLLKELFNENVGLVGLAFLCICPWHIMISRWALESNLAPSFLLIGLLFFVKVLNNNKYFMLSALFYGLSLYAYAITWIVVPLTLLGLCIYALINKKIVSIKHCLISCLVLMIFASPLIMFLLVNKGIINEITTRFISIPKLTLMRESEISLLNLLSLEQWRNIFMILFVQSDGLLWNSVPGSGVFYYISLPFLFYGVFVIFKRMIGKLKNKEFGNEFILFYLLMVSVLCAGCIKNPNINKINNIWLILIMYIVLGICEFVGKYKKYRFDVALLYVLFFLIFYVNYLASYNEEIKVNFNYDAKDVIEHVEKFGNRKIYIEGIRYSQVLFYSQLSPNDFKKSVVYEYDNSRWIPVKSFANYYFEIDYACLDHEGVYVVLKDNGDMFSDDKYNISTFGKYIVAVPK